MGFMQKQITNRRKWFEIETLNGTEFFDCEDFTEEQAVDNCSTKNNYAQSVGIRVGYGVRLSAPGYLDCTSWSVFDTVAEAEAYLDEMYGDDEDSEEESDE